MSQSTAAELLGLLTLHLLQEQWKEAHEIAMEIKIDYRDGRPVAVDFAVPVLPSERSAGDERKCINHCEHEQRFSRDNDCIFNECGFPSCAHHKVCCHRYTFAPRPIESLWGANLPALCDTCKSDLSREGRGTHGWDASRNQILCPTVCKFPRKDGHRGAEKHGFTESLAGPYNICVEVVPNDTGYSTCGLPREAEVHIGRDV